MKFDLSTFIFKKLGINESASIALEAIIYSIILLFFLIIIWIVGRKILTVLFVKVSKLTKTKFDDLLIKNKIPSTLAYFPPILLSIRLFPIILSDIKVISGPIILLMDLLLTLLVISIIRRVLNTLKDFLKTIPNFRDKPIDSYMQVVMIFVWFVGIMIIFSIISGKDIGAFLATLGALSAIILLIFRDTILGFVASIQVTINDMVRIGDWITMKSYNADGDVIEINLSTVKVQNFDKTITTIPTYRLVSDSFVNWRGMSESGGRRIKRSILIKVSSIKFLEDSKLSELKKIERISNYINERKNEIEEENKTRNINKNLLLNGRNITNIGLFRRYALAYLDSHPEVNKDLTLMVRQLAPTAQGVPIEIYAFAADKKWENYEQIMSDIFDHLLASIPFFELECFEYSYPSNPKK